MTYEQTPRNKKREREQMKKNSQPKQAYKNTRNEHLREIARLLREIRRQVLLIRQAKLTYRIEK